MAEKNFHNPVMLDEVIKYLNIKEGSAIVDATVGTGGHAYHILKKLSKAGRLIALDRDQQSIMQAKARLEEFGERFIPVHSDFRYLDKVLADLKVERIDGILFDLGISSFQLDNSQRGFSFSQEGPLDMRMDETSYISAYDLVNNLTEKEISGILWSFGQERLSNRIARYLVRSRLQSPISTTAQLKDIIVKAAGYRYHRQKIHPATRTFQALRIAVNRELEALEEALDKLPLLLNKGARACVISFHSLEDRIAKHNFKKNNAQGIYKIITRKPLMAGEAEVKNNPRSRSAKLRAAERI